MKRHLFYDKNTGEILHTHQVFKFGSEKPQAVSKDELAMLTNRQVDPKRIRHTTVTVAPQSSHRVLRSVNPKTGKLVTKRTPKNHWKKDAAGGGSPTPAKGGN